MSASSHPLPATVGTAALALAWVWPFAGGPSPATLPWLVSAACLSVWVLVEVWRRPDVLHCDASAWLIAALLSSAIGMLQFFGVSAWFKPWMNVTALGDAFGNLRQRNQFSTLTMIGLAVLMWGPLAGRLTGRHSGLPSSLHMDPGVHFVNPAGPAVWPGLLAAALLAAGNAASSSRTGLLQLGLVVLLVLCWKSHASPGTLPRLAVAVATYAVASLALPLLAGLDPWSNGIAGRFGDADRACGSRRLLWANVLHLIAQRPWWGWGWGELDYAHFVTVYPGARFCDILDNAHNLPLHLAVELGVPVAVLASSLAGWLVLRARPWRESDGRRRMAWAVLALIGVHSLLEYPLWYGPFQIAAVLSIWILWRTPVDSPSPSVAADAAPAGFPAQPSARAATWISAGAIVALSALAYAAWDYYRVSQLYRAPQQRSAAYRDDTLAKVRDSWLYRHQVRFAELTLSAVTPINAQSLHRTAHALLHFSPEARVVGKLIDSALVLGRTEEALFYMRRFRIAFPEEYQRWRDSREPVAELPALDR